MRKSVCVLIGVVVFLLANAVSAQPWRDGPPPPRERRMTPQDFGDVDRLERPHQNKDDSQDKLSAIPNRQFGWGPGKNKYGGPLDGGMRNWGGDPWKQFGPGRPWGGPGGPPKSFRGRGPNQEVRGNPFYNGGRGRQYHGGREDFKRSPEKSKCNGDCPFCKKCPFCGSKVS